MEENEVQPKDSEEIIKMNINQFIEATRQYLFEAAATQAVLVAMPVSKDR